MTDTKDMFPTPWEEIFVDFSKQALSMGGKVTLFSNEAETYFCVVITKKDNDKHVLADGAATTREVALFKAMERFSAQKI